MSRMWVMQMAILATVAVAVFWGFYTLDHFALSPPGESSNPFERYLNFDPGSLSDAFASLAGVNAAVFGIVITVVSIIVQLTADRYTGVARMFLRDRINVLVPAYYVVCCVASVWLSASLQDDYVPRATLAAILSMTTGGFVIMAPYFGYVFWFLDPPNIIARIRAEAVDRATRGSVTEDQAERHRAQALTLFSMEELTDVTNNSISGRDKIIASGSVDALKDFAVEYIKLKPRARPEWFSIGPDIRLNPDFVAMDPESLADLEERRTWVEWKVMRQYLSIYNEALGSMRDINYLIAIDTRYIGEAAAHADDKELIGLVYRFMNSYVRSTLNAKDIRTAYNILNQYRKLVESMLRAGNTRAAVDGVRHMKYYCLVSVDLGLNFVAETVAYDVSALAHLAHELGSPAEQEILAEFLELDRPPYTRAQSSALLGVRKAQVKLAAYYLHSGEEARARAIANDMRHEPQERLETIQRQLSNVESKDFWEIIDRGRNFEWMPPEHRGCLDTFFSWLKVDPPSAG